MFKKRIDSAKSRGILLIDDLISLPYCLNPLEEYADMKRQLIAMITKVKRGITQLTTHPSMTTDELQAITPHYREREMEYRLFNDPEIKQLLQREGIKLVSWSNIRDLQRSIS
ncbi:YdjC-like protein [Paenibacillus sp. 1_12]|nr:hypothetical protein [Paenibacillus sp. 1_12]SFL94338.1 YdjC-like protein [Paenibacillus sp. 1_12]